MIISIISCTSSPKNHSHDTENSKVDEHLEHGDSEMANEAKLSDDQIKSIGIQIGTLEKKQLTSSLKASGILKVPNQNRATATSLIGGVINTIAIQTGNSVKKGQVIASLSNISLINIQEEYLSSVAKLSFSEFELKRQQELQRGDATALKNLQQAESEINGLRARKASLQKQLELVGINSNSLTNENIQKTVNILSPINGSISNVHVNIGSFVEASNPIAEIIDNSQLHLDLFVYEKDLSKLKVGQTIHFTLTNNPGKEYDAKLFAISNTFEQNTKAIAVHATVEGNKQGLIDGMSITAIISLEKALLETVPNEAIVNYQGQDYIFLVSDLEKDEDHQVEHNHSHNSNELEHSDKHESETIKSGSKETTFIKVPIKKGVSDIGYTEITLLKEIPPNSKIVAKGAFFIMAKMTNQGEAHEH